MNEIAKIQLTEGQEKACSQLVEWFDRVYDNEIERRKTPVFRIFGYAGVGKTFLTKTALQRLRDKYSAENKILSVISGAYTGKACLVMERNGIPAQTIHSTIYKVNVPDRNTVEGLHKKIAELPDTDEGKTARKELGDQLAKAEKLSFTLNDESPLNNADLYQLDEVSMVNAEMKDDILKFGVPLLVLGDPGQLPPVEGAGALVNSNPDVMLTEIMRQAAGNPIIKLSILARGGAYIPMQEFGDGVEHTRQIMLTNERVLKFDQILVGKNTTRLALNKRIRGLKGFSGDRYPVVGDKLICLKNDKEVGIFNGLMVTVLERLEEYDETIKYRVEDESGRKIIVKILRIYFDAYDNPDLIKNAKWWDFEKGSSFDYGYAITVHKSQGSQWDNVLLWDDKFFVWDKPQRAKWLYTGVTRAAEKLTIAS